MMFKRPMPVFRKLFLIGYLFLAQCQQPGNNGDILNRHAHLIYTHHARCRMDCRHINEKEVKEILLLLYPFLRLKKVLAQEVLNLIKTYPEKMTPKELVANLMRKKGPQAARCSNSRSTASTSGRSPGF
jgi:hypothetical protein